METSIDSAYLNSLFENSPEAIVLLDEHNRVIQANPEFYRLFGYTKAEVEGRHIDMLVAGGEEYAEAVHFSEEAEAGRHLNAESIRHRKDGQPVEVSILGAPIEVEGKVVGIFGIYRDISDRKRVERKLALSERKHRELFENAPIGIFQSTSEGRFITVNDSMARIFGFDDTESVVAYYKDLANTLYYRPGRRAQFLDALLKDGEVKNFELEAYRRDEVVIWVSLNARISYWYNNGSFIIDGFISDMTDLKQTEHKLQTSLREKNVLLQEVHHRVKNNMQIISSMLNLEAMNVGNSHNKELLFVMQNRIQAMALVHEKLYASEQIEVVDLGEYTRELCMQVLDVISKELAPKVDFRLESIPAGIDFSVPYGLIVNELVMNAYKHAFEGIDFPKITIELRHQAGQLMLKIVDNGVGLPDNFDIAKTSTLGMNLIHSLIVQLDGQFSLFNRKGTVWEILFPPGKWGAGL
ncbi:MAG: PAS domain S-box protein [Spirochaetaceae bacterium]|nr:PAS domain S-box protein [Spirochaetaceae bacterium]MCF7949703.1 PAS domain S-box protein [Spirochaetia bacterium]MCF7951800.1 PAS domain S-box protein [Spirochaetaceae bacterium]